MVSVFLDSVQAHAAVHLVVDMLILLFLRCSSTCAQLAPCAQSIPAVEEPLLQLQLMACMSI